MHRRLRTVTQWPFFLTLSLTLITCQNRKSFVESERYHVEEMVAYNDILNDIADTTTFKNAKRRLLFFFLLTRSPGTNLTTDDHEAEKEYLEVKLEPRRISVEGLTGIKKYRFVRATSYPKIKNNDLIAQDPIEIREGERYLHTWLKLSRIIFNKDLTVGFLISTHTAERYARMKTGWTLKKYRESGN